MTDEIKKLELVVPKGTTHIDMNGLKQLFLVASVARTLDVFAGIAMDFAKAADAELDRLAPFTQWVAVADELPPEKQNVSVYHPAHGHGIGYWCNEGQDFGTVWYCRYQYVQGGYPTHWHVMIADPS